MDKRLPVAAMLLGAALFAAAPFAVAQRMRMIQEDRGSFLGVSMEDVTAAAMSRYKLSEERGVIVRSISQGSPADEAGIQEGDVLMEYGGFPVWSAAQMSRLVQETPAGRKVAISLLRDGKRIHTTAVLREREDASMTTQREWPPRLNNPGRRMFGFPDRENDPYPNRGGQSLDDHPRLGITLQPLTDQLAEFMGVAGKKGVLVASVLPGSAGEGKLKPGDVIIAVNDRPMNDPEDFARYIRRAEAGDIELNIIRDKKEVVVRVNLPATGGRGGYKL